MTAKQRDEYDARLDLGMLFINSLFDGEVNEADGLWDALRGCRKGLSDKTGDPAWAIFSNETLEHMIELHPRNLKEMLKVKGVGPAKLEKYGTEFLEVLIRFEPVEPRQN